LIGGSALFGRKRRQEWRFDQEATRYQMRQRMISIGDDYVIENENDILILAAAAVLDTMAHPAR
jgi:hypothetical protein